MQPAQDDREQWEEGGIALASRDQEIAVLGDRAVPDAVPVAEDAQRVRRRSPMNRGRSLGPVQAVVGGRCGEHQHPRADRCGEDRAPLSQPTDHASSLTIRRSRRDRRTVARARSP